MPRRSITLASVKPISRPFKGARAEKSEDFVGQLAGVR